MNCAFSALHRENLKTKLYFHGEEDRPHCSVTKTELYEIALLVKTPASPCSGYRKHFEYEAVLETVTLRCITVPELHSNTNP